MRADEIAKHRGKIAAHCIVMRAFFIQIAQLKIGMAVPFAGKIVIFIEEMEEFHFLSDKRLFIANPKHAVEIFPKFLGMLFRVAMPDEIEPHVLRNARKSSERRQAGKDGTKCMIINDLLFLLLNFPLFGNVCFSKTRYALNDRFHLRRHGQPHLLKRERPRPGA